MLTLTRARWPGVGRPQPSFVASFVLPVGDLIPPFVAVLVGLLSVSRRPPRSVTLELSTPRITTTRAPAYPEPETTLKHNT